jgi:hypothetical protein
VAVQYTGLIQLSGHHTSDLYESAAKKQYLCRLDTSYDEVRELRSATLIRGINKNNRFPYTSAEWKTITAQ